MYNSNGPPKGFNITSDQSSYDLVSKDIIVCSDLGSPNPDKTVYSFNLGTDNINNIYKAELVSASIKFNTSINTEVINKTLILSIPHMNQNTFYVAGNNNGSNANGTYGNTPTQSQIFCQVPDNNTPLTPIGVLSNNIISLYISGKMFDTVQYYNPPINRINFIGVSWFTPNANVVPVDTSGASGTINTFYFTLRIYYFQKRNNTSSFSTSLLNYAASGTDDSIFQPFHL